MAEITPKILSKVLLIDDDASNRKLLEMHLKGKYRVEEAENGLIGLEKTNKFKPDVVLLDLMMPEMDGIEYCKALRQDPKHAFRKVIVVSGKTTLDDRLEAYDIGADDYLVKPFKKQELLAKIKVWLRYKNIEEINQIRNELFSLFSHETKTPLTTIDGYGQVLLHQNVSEEKQKDFARKILNATSELNSLIKKVTLYCELKSDLDIKSSNVSLNLLKKKVETFANRKGEKIEVKGNWDVNLNIDIYLWDKIFDLLLDNAVRYQNAKESISVEFLVKENDHYCFDFQNAGKIEEDTLESIMDEFKVVNIMKHHRGAGISLPIVQRILDLHEGELKIDNFNQDEQERVSLKLKFKCQKENT